jgi:hypothetical protein
MANRLAAEKSPYLLQHANNPVDWHPWSEEAFAKARAEGKPIFLSIGYSTCHWCHVMERESFENPDVAQVMNELFVNVKVDREERPDVDRVYMAFVQGTTGGGGWPMSVWLTPELEPFFGGTYFPPDDRGGRPGFVSLCRRIGQLWTERRADLVTSGEQVIEQMRDNEARLGEPTLLDESVNELAFKVFRQLFDAELGGFGKAPKFPRPVVHNFLFRHFARGGSVDAAHMVLGTLWQMSNGGMYDHLGGGFHRYSVDRFWHVPHFEKMLYDQAQLVVSYVDAFQVSGDDLFAKVARSTCDYVLRDLTSAPHGGFYSAEDADSLPPGAAGGENKEGAFYVWTKQELDAALGPDAEAFCTYYGVREAGNADDPHGELTGQNILHVSMALAELAKRIDKTPEDTEALLERARAKLLAIRATRPRPHLDDKVLTAWNGMMIGALARAGSVLGEPRYVEAAARAARFLESALWDPASKTLHRRWRDGERAVEGYLDDYASFIAGLIDLYEATFDLALLRLAETVADEMIRRFHDDKDGGFFATSGTDPSVLLRLKEDYDGAEPSGSSVAAHALLRLGELLDRADFTKAAQGTLRCFSARLKEAPHALPQMLVALDHDRHGAVQIVIAGERGDARTTALIREANRAFLPARLLILADQAARRELGARLGWIAAMGPIDGEPAAYVCKERSCDRPVTSTAELAAALPRRDLPEG